MPSCNESRQGFVTTLRIKAQVIPQRESFQYFGSMINNAGTLEEDVEYMIRARWLKWRLTYEVLCDRHVQIILKEIFYKTTIRNFITYGSDCWPIKLRMTHKQKMDTS